MPVDRAALLAEAFEAARSAHAPYSRFGVGAAVLLADGRVVRGANFENASYGLSLCAETVALAAVNMAGALRDVVAVGVVGGVIGTEGLQGDAAVRPCGRCRQVLNEAAQLGGRDIEVFCASADGAVVERHLLSDLLPHAFGPADLG
ncbi:MAG TPA: cytidine deaminase [Sphingomonadaceae bacterium]|nr:cytidine deaminase [Sphingomonadaceae bacterium]